MRISIIGWREGRNGDRGNEGTRAARYNGIVHTQLITAHSYACDREWGSQAVTAVGPFHLPANLSYVPIFPSTAYHQCCYCNLQIAAANDRKSSRTEENGRLNLYDLCLQFQLAGRRKTYEAHPSFRAASCLVLWTVIPLSPLRLAESFCAHIRSQASPSPLLPSSIYDIFTTRLTC